jgi:hypothetical protein
MIRLVIGSILGGIAQWFVGFVFWGTPLGRLPFNATSDNQNAALQTALAQTLTPTGTGTYMIPWPFTQQGTVLYGKGPVAMVHFNTAGFPVMDTSAIIAGLILSIVAIFLLALALWFVADRVSDFASRAKIVVLAAVATSLYFTIGEPVYNSYLPWPYFIYLGIGNILGMVAGGLVVVRWFLPKAAPATVH